MMSVPPDATEAPPEDADALRFRAVCDAVFGVDRAPGESDAAGTRRHRHVLLRAGDADLAGADLEAPGGGRAPAARTRSTS